jgi:hypothetical protein
MADAVEEGLIAANPVLRIRSGRRRRVALRARSQSDPLTPFEIAEFLAMVPAFYRTLYDVWFRLGWRSSEMVALRFRNLDFARQVIRIDTGRMPRFGGIEAHPKTGPWEVDCGYDARIFTLLGEARQAKGNPAPDAYVFTDPAGQPLSQDWLHKRVWLVTLRRADLRGRGQYNIRDSFISIALSAGEDPGWVAKVCGTSEEMIFRHYRTWIPGLNPDAGVKVGRVLSGVGGGNLPPSASPVASPAPKTSAEAQRDQLLKRVEAGGIEPPSEGASPNASTSVAGDLSFAAFAPIGRIARGQPAKDLDPRTAGVAGAQPEKMASRPALRAPAGETWSPN